MTMQFKQQQIVSGGQRPSDMVPVWDILVRVFHWSLVVSFAAVWLTSDDFVWLHVILGYGVLALIGVRVIWGFVGGKYARFTNFVRSPATVLAYIKDMYDGRAARFSGHNPAGGAMIMVLLGALIVTGVSGWMSTTDAYWGIRWVEILHTTSAAATIVLVAGHIAGVIYSSRAHGENLVKAMITGRKSRG